MTKAGKYILILLFILSGGLALLVGFVLMLLIQYSNGKDGVIFAEISLSAGVILLLAAYGSCFISTSHKENNDVTPE